MSTAIFEADELAMLASQQSCHTSQLPQIASISSNLYTPCKLPSVDSGRRGISRKFQSRAQKRDFQQFNESTHRHQEVEPHCKHRSEHHSQNATLTAFDDDAVFHFGLQQRGHPQLFELLSPQASQSTPVQQSQGVQQQFRYPTQTLQHQRYHPHLTNQTPTIEIEEGVTATEDNPSRPSMVNHPRTLDLTPQRKTPKVKFTPTEDALLIELKETRKLSWKRIAEFFPSRTFGTLQVRYSTKLKTRTMVWTDDTIRQLHVALREYEEERWKIVAGKVGNGFSANACKDKATELLETESLLLSPRTPPNEEVVSSPDAH